VAHKHWLFFGDETWWVGHPAFGMSQQNMWRKLSKAETLNQFYMPAGPSDEQLRAMLYTGDDDQWKTARSELKPFFYKYDFSKLDDRMDSVCQKHLQRIAMEHHGEEELLELLLTITVYLLGQCLYRCALPWDELEILTEYMAEYVVPGTAKNGKFAGNLSALE
jgi:cytochrome P450